MNFNERVQPEPINKRRILNLLKSCSPDMLISKNDEAVLVANEVAKALNSFKDESNFNIWPKGFIPPRLTRFVGNVIKGEKFDSEKTILSKFFNFPSTPSDYLIKLENFLKTGMIFNKNQQRAENKSYESRTETRRPNQSHTNDFSYEESTDTLEREVWKKRLINTFKTYGLGSLTFGDMMRELVDKGLFKKEEILGWREVRRIAGINIISTALKLGLDSISFENEVKKIVELGIMSRGDLAALDEIKEIVKKQLISKAKVYGVGSFTFKEIFNKIIKLELSTKKDIAAMPEIKEITKAHILNYTAGFGTDFSYLRRSIEDVIGLGIFTQEEIFSWPELKGKKFDSKF